MKVPLSSLRFPLLCFLYELWHDEPILEMTINHFDIIPQSCVSAITYTVIFSVYHLMSIYDTVDNIATIIQKLKQRIHTDWIIMYLKAHTQTKQQLTLYIDNNNMVYFNELPCNFATQHNTIKKTIDDENNKTKSLFLICVAAISYEERHDLYKNYTMPLSTLPKPVKWIIE
jgi:hypothetical protein